MRANLRRARRRRRQLARPVGGLRRHDELRDVAPATAFIVAVLGGEVGCGSLAVLAACAIDCALSGHRYCAAAISTSARFSGCVESPTDSFAGSDPSDERLGLRGASGTCVRTGDGAVRRRRRPRRSTVSACTVADGGSGRGALSASRYLPITRARRHRCDVVSASSGASSSAIRCVRNARGASLSCSSIVCALRRRSSTRFSVVAGALDQRAVDGDHARSTRAPSARALEHRARVVAIGAPRERGEHVGDRALRIVRSARRGCARGAGTDRRARSGAHAPIATSNASSSCFHTGR